MTEIRPYSGDVHAFMEAVELPFGWGARREDTDAFAPLVELDRSLAAYDGERVVGTAGAFSMRISVPGGELPMAGVTMVGVHPTHRRRGLLRQMMRRQLDDIRQRGEPLAGLWASEGAIYQRFGYGHGTFTAAFEIERLRAGFRTPLPPVGRMRLVDADEAAAAFPSVFGQVRQTRAGIFERSDAWWRSEFLYDPEHNRRGGSAVSLLLHETDGVATGYARYRLFPDWDERGPKGALEVHEVVAVNPEATVAIWRYLLDVDLVATIRSRNLPVDHPLPLLLAEPRRLGWRVGDGMWLRLVDVRAALEARAWAADGRVVLELADPFCDWNAGRWEVTVDDGHARVARTDADPDLALDCGDLAALYLGAMTPARLVLAGRVREVTPGAASRAGGMLRVDLAPWCPQIF